MTLAEFAAAVKKLAWQVEAPAGTDDVRIVVDFDRRSRKARQVMVQPTEREQAPMV